MNFVMRRRGYALARKICKGGKGMTKHFCDKCGKEVSARTMWDIHCDARNTETHFHFEVCSECMLKLNKLLDSKSESEVQDADRR